MNFDWYPAEYFVHPDDFGGNEYLCFGIKIMSEKLILGNILMRNYDI